MIGVSIPGISDHDKRRVKIQEQFFYLSFHVLAVKFYICEQGIVELRPIFQRKRRAKIGAPVKPILLEKTAQSTVRKVQENYILLLHSHHAKRLTRFLFAQLPIVPVILRRGPGDAVFLFYAFRKTVAAGHKHDFDGSSKAKYPLYETSGCQSLIVWMRGKDHQAGVLR